MSRWMRRMAKLGMLLTTKEWRRGLLYGVAAGTEHQHVLRSLSPKTIVDVGAHRGQFSLLCSTIHPDAYIHAFEPLPGPAATFRRLFSSKPEVALHPIALGQRSGPAKMNVSRRSDSSSLLAITPMQARVFPGTEMIGVQTVDVSTMEECLESQMIVPPALLKIDVQGAELDVLKGAAKLIGMFNHIYVECSFAQLYEGQALAHEVVEYLGMAGFTLKGAYNVAYDETGLSVQADFLFTAEVEAQ